MTVDLTSTQSRFLAEYLTDRRALDAAARAGFDFVLTGDAYYCYLLVDPRDQAVFYVGKGKGKRIGNHARRALAGHIDNVEKYRRIRSIHAAGCEVLELVFSAHVPEAEAFAVERRLIQALREHGLTNISGGVVTNEEAGHERVLEMLRRMKTYAAWVGTASEYQLFAAAKLRGTARAFYDDSLEALLGMSGLDEEDAAIVRASAYV